MGCFSIYMWGIYAIDLAKYRKRGLFKTDCDDLSNLPA